MTETNGAGALLSAEQLSPELTADYLEHHALMPLRLEAGSETELAAAGGNISRLARKLDIARSTLRYRISLHKILRQSPQD